MAEAHPNDQYPLPRSIAETGRLNEQHKHLVSAFGFHIHSSIPVQHDMPNLRVADIACGSGIWLTEVATQYPNAQCDGFDISGAQFPALPDLERNFGDRVNFHVKDATAKDGYGKEFEQQFDVVAVRLLHVSIAGAQWTQAVKNAAALLKPGGALQWIDWDPLSAHLLQSRPLVAHTAIAELLEGFNQFLSKTDTGATARLPQEMRDSGLLDVRSELFALDEDRGWREHFLWTMVNVMPDYIMKRAAKAPGDSDGGKALAKVKADAQEEAKQEGVWVRTEMWCHVGRKPL